MYVWAMQSCLHKEACTHKHEDAQAMTIEKVKTWAQANNVMCPYNPAKVRVAQSEPGSARGEPCFPALDMMRAGGEEKRARALDGEAATPEATGAARAAPRPITGEQPCESSPLPHRLLTEFNGLISVAVGEHGGESREGRAVESNHSVRTKC